MNSLFKVRVLFLALTVMSTTAASAATINDTSEATFTSEDQLSELESSSTQHALLLPRDWFGWERGILRDFFS